MLAILLDHHIRAEIATALRHRGLDVLTAFDDGSSRIDDEELLARATLLGRVLVSQDRDLLAIAARWQEEGRPFPGWYSLGNRMPTWAAHVSGCCLSPRLCCRKKCRIASNSFPSGVERSPWGLAGTG
jgi:predicted nuclease of predicted toxin-antitoxin system